MTQIVFKDRIFNKVVFFILSLFLMNCSKNGVKKDGEKPTEPQKVFRPNMLLIEGGRSLLGFENLEFESKQTQTYAATVETFYMDETEVSNIQWLEYLFFIRRRSDQEYLAALPDTNVWSLEFSFNDFYVENYFRHPAFRYYPLVGVSWLQANEYCKWRSSPLIKKVAEEVQKRGTGKRIQLGDSLWVYEGYRTPKNTEKKEIEVTYRLPTEAEWIYAAGTFSYHKPYLDEKDFYRRVYPWDGTGLRNPYSKKKGYFFANFKRSRGDYSGVARSKNDGASFTEYVYSYPPNDVGLYNMAGNVNEWVQDIKDFVPTEVAKYEFNKKEHEDKDGNKVEAKTEDEENDNFQLYLEEERYRVYKGGSWNDVAYWLSPFTRRFFAEDSSASTIGFRCVMEVAVKDPEGDKELAVQKEADDKKAKENAIEDEKTNEIKKQKDQENQKKIDSKKQKELEKVKEPKPEKKKKKIKTEQEGGEENTDEKTEEDKK